MLIDILKLICREFNKTNIFSISAKNQFFDGPLIPLRIRSFGTNIRPIRKTPDSKRVYFPKQNMLTTPNPIDMAEVTIQKTSSQEGGTGTGARSSPTNSEQKKTADLGEVGCSLGQGPNSQSSPHKTSLSYKKP